MNKIIIGFFLLLPSLFFAQPTWLSDLPWICANDIDALHFAGVYLPSNPVIVEAGVCHGTNVLRMREKWPQAKIYCFEPHQLFFQELQAKFKNLSTIKTYNLALFDHVGTTVFNMSENLPEASSILADNLKNVVFPQDLERTGDYQDKATMVPCTTLNYWTETEGVLSVDYLALSTEGTELTILQNATDILANVKVISTCIHFQEFRKGMTLFKNLYDFLTNRGFTLVFIWGRSDWQGVAIFVQSKYLQE